MVKTAKKRTIMDYSKFGKNSSSVLAPISGIVLLLARGAVNLLSCFSMLDQQHRIQEQNDKKA